LGRVAWDGSGYDRKRAAGVFDAVAAPGMPGGAAGRPGLPASG